LTEHLVRRAARSGMAPEQFAHEIVSAGQVPALMSEVLRGKALALVLESAVVTDASGRSVDLAALPGGAPGLPTEIIDEVEEAVVSEETAPPA
jgi:trigger factor